LSQPEVRVPAAIRNVLYANTAGFTQISVTRWAPVAYCEEFIQEIRNLSSEAHQPVEVVDLRALAAKGESD